MGRRFTIQKSSLLDKESQIGTLREKWMRLCPRGWEYKLVRQNHLRNWAKDFSSSKEEMRKESIKLRSLSDREFLILKWLRGKSRGLHSRREDQVRWTSTG